MSKTKRGTKTVHVPGYRKRDGTYVRTHKRSTPSKGGR